MRALLGLAILVAACGPSPHGGTGTPDAAGSGGNPDAPPGGPGPDAATGDTAVYAHTADTLFRVDPDSFAVTQVGAFQWPASVGSDQMTDLAIDKNGRMIGVSYGSVYEVDPLTAKTTLLSSTLQGMFNGLTFVPADQLGRTGDDVLIGDRNTDGKIFEIDPHTGAATQVGDMGHGYVSSGDLVSIKGFGTVATTGDGLGNDTLVRLAPITFDATPIGSDTGQSKIWGVGFWKGKVYGFTDGGAFVLIDTTSGAASPVSSAPDAWWGAAVTTVAPIVVN